MLLEAVPNLSLGPGSDVLDGLLDRLAEERSPGWALLDVHSDADHNRTVLTMAGAPVPLERALLAAIELLAEEATLVGHEGVHPRVGVIDVVPLVPLADARDADARRTAERAIHHLVDRAVPVYRYGRLAPEPRPRPLSEIRSAIAWEGKAAPLGLAPDAGPDRFHPRLGAACVGVRDPLIAYNVVLDSTDVGLGRSIARELRPANGGLPGLMALAFPLASRGGLVQVSTNITDVDAAGPADVFAFVEERAREAGTDVVEGELVGLAPERALSEPAAMGLSAAPDPLEARLRAAGLPDAVP